jgi:WhiB family transcriptional regulator, redox-sensing transcriptional regulator
MPLTDDTEGAHMAYRDGSDWYDDAACQGLGFQEFFDAEQLTAAREICSSCPVRAKCLQFAIDNGITAGIWGGLTPLERRRVRPPRTWVA